MQPTYPAVAAALLVGLVIGWFAHSSLELRYQITPVSGGLMKVDKRSGEAWLLGPQTKGWEKMGTK
jgi:hypothetical protein